MLNSTHSLINPTRTTLEGYLLEFESSVSFDAEYSRKSLSLFVEVCLSLLEQYTAHIIHDNSKIANAFGLCLCGRFVRPGPEVIKGFPCST